MQAQFQIGRYGISDDLVQHIRGAWRLHEIVRLQICSPWKDNMKELVKRLELKTGGLVLDRAGSRLLLYRGFTDMDLARKGITDPFQFQEDQEARMEQNNTFVEFAEPSEIDDDDYYDSVKDDDDNGVDGVDDDGDGYAIEEAGEGESLEDEILGAQGRGQEPMNGKTEGSREKNARAVVYRSDVEEERSRRVGDVRMGAVAFGTEVGDEKAGGMGRDDAGSVVLGRELDEGEVREVGREGVGPMALGGEIEDRQRGTSVGIVGSGAVGRRPGGEAQSSLRGVGPGPKRDAGRRGAERYQRGAEGHGKSWERNRRDAAMSRAGDSAAVTGRLWRDAKRRNDDDDDDDDCDESAGPLGPLDNEAAGGMGAGPRAAAMGERVSDSGAFGDDEAGGLEELSELDISAAARNRPGRTASSARSRRR
ncbi:unnamed protein product [Ostreobium quekettii]|uniref:CRM domain-containing protein n=1 Tax=Ostreobium quekettii TaxID=121088 RepID=A0A8S1ILB9_9CHLO|nr:unnamed protein product [Ostreobium quekettii]